MKTDTANHHWNDQWAAIQAGSKWLTPEPDVKAWSNGLAPASRILDLGAGVGRHALWLAGRGFNVTALDAAADGLARIDAMGGVTTVNAPMHTLPFDDQSFDHVLSWNVIYHGDEAILSQTISEIHRVLRPGGTFHGTMLTKRAIALTQAKLPGGREISRNTWVFDDDEGDKRHPHYFCDSTDLMRVFADFDILRVSTDFHEGGRGGRWHLILERPE